MEDSRISKMLDHRERRDLNVICGTELNSLVQVVKKEFLCTR